MTENLNTSTAQEPSRKRKAIAFVAGASVLALGVSGVSAYLTTSETTPTYNIGAGRG